MRLHDSPDKPWNSLISRPPFWLVGLMACGKSSVMQVLTEAHWYKWIDMDSVISQQQSMTISEIFNQFTATGFRLIEESVVHNLSHTIWQNTVVATGGGAPCFFRNMRKMNNSGVTVFLDGAPELLADRTLDDEKAGKPARPLVAGMDRDARIKKFQELDGQRRHFYKQSQVTISIWGKSINDIVEEMLHQLPSKG